MSRNKTRRRELREGSLLQKESTGVKALRQLRNRICPKNQKRKERVVPEWVEG